VAFIQAFQKRGIYPEGVRTLSVESLLWRGPQNDEYRPSRPLAGALVKTRDYAEKNLYTESRKKTFKLEREFRRDIHKWLKKHFASGAAGRKDAAYLGLNPDGIFEVRAARVAYRSSPDGGMLPQLLLTLLQTTEDVPVDPGDPTGTKMAFEGGSVVIADLRSSTIRYCIRKSAGSGGRLVRQQQFAMASSGIRSAYLGKLYPKDTNEDYRQKARRRRTDLTEPFAAMHRGL
jgi:hypothetical protein